jgi:long-chain acyl-CoA synthetase
MPVPTYSVPISEPGTNCSAVYRHVRAQKAIRTHAFDSDLKTIYEGFQKTVKRCGNRPFLGTRSVSMSGVAGDYVWKTFAEVDEISRKVARGIVPHCPRKTLHGWTFAAIGVWSRNREELYITDIACERQDITVVPLYETLGEEAVFVALDQTQLEVLCISKDIEAKLIPMLAKMETLKVIIHFDSDPGKDFLKAAKEHGKEVHYYFDFLKLTAL